MSNHQPVTSHHLRLFSQFAPYLVEVRPSKSRLGYILASVTSPDRAELERFAAYLERARMIRRERDLKVQRLKQSLTAIFEASLAKQDQEVRRNPSRPAVRRLVVSQQPYAGHWYPIAGPYQVVPLVSLVRNWIEDRTVAVMYKSDLRVWKRPSRLAKDKDAPHTRAEWETFLKQRSSSFFDLLSALREEVTNG